jgi:hypothetical protein
MSSCTESLLRYLVGGPCHLEGIEAKQRSSALRPKELFNRRWIADFTYIWTAEGWRYVAAVVDLSPRDPAKLQLSLKRDLKRDRHIRGVRTQERSPKDPRG